MSTLIRNVGILDARKATPEKLASIGKLINIGVLVTNPEIKEQLMKISMLNVGSTLELSDDYKFHTGNHIINRTLLEASESALKMVMIGQITVEADVPLELMQSKLDSLYLVGHATVPENLYGAFMSHVKEITGQVDVLPDTGKAIVGKVQLSDSYLEGLEDGTELAVVGKLLCAEKLSEELFTAKITALSVVGVIGCLDTQETLLRKVLKDTGKTKFKITRSDCHNLPDGSRLDPFTLMSITKPLVCSSGILILEEQITPELLQEQDLKFEATVVYFPSALMKAMLTRLEKGTKGFPYEPGKLEVTGGHQQLTKVRLEAMNDHCTLVVCGELEVDSEVTPESLAAKIGSLDNYGRIMAAKDAASILQSKLRQNEGAIKTPDGEEDDTESENYDHVIENVATYVI